MYFFRKSIFMLKYYITTYLYLYLFYRLYNTCLHKYVFYILYSNTKHVIIQITYIIPIISIYLHILCIICLLDLDNSIHILFLLTSALFI